MGAQSAKGAAGTLGHAGALSFHPRKTLTTGEGGMVTTNDPHLAERARALRNHGAASRRSNATQQFPPEKLFQ